MELAKLAILIFTCISCVCAFTCPDDSHTFYHADVSTGCQVYHLCENSQLQTLTCPSGKAFNHATSVCEDATTVNCYETMDHHDMHHHHKRSVDEYHTISISAAKNKVVELYRAIKPMVISAVKEVAPSVYTKFEVDYLPSLRSVRDEAMPIVYEKLMPQIRQLLQYSRRIATRLVEKAYKSYEMSNSTHITFASMSDLATDVSNDLQPVIRLGRFMSSKLIQPTRSKRSVDSFGIPELLGGFVEPVVRSIFTSMGATLTGQENTVTSKVILPILYEMIQDPETRFNLMKIWFSAKSAFTPVVWEMLSRQTYSTPEGAVIRIPRAVFDSAKTKLMTETKPILHKIFAKHLSMMLMRASKNVHLILQTVDTLKRAKYAHGGVLKDALLNFIAKHGSLYESSNSQYVNTYTLSEIKRDLRPVFITILQVFMDYFSKTPNSWMHMFFNKDSIIFKSLIGTPEYAKPAPVAYPKIKPVNKKIVVHRRTA